MVRTTVDAEPQRNRFGETSVRDTATICAIMLVVSQLEGN